MLVSQALFAEEFFKGEKLDEKEIIRIMKIVAKERRNLVLVGMPGVGKSTVGKALSELSGKEVIDTDEEIVKTVGISIPEIFKKGGEPFFRELESEAVKKASEGFGRIIVTGGGAVKTEANFLPLKRTSKIYHLERDVATLSRDGRPLSQGADLEKMYKERLPMYKRFCDDVIAVEKEAEVTARKIWSDFFENSCN